MQHTVSILLCLHVQLHATTDQVTLIVDLLPCNFKIWHIIVGVEQPTPHSNLLGF